MAAPNRQRKRNKKKGNNAEDLSADPVPQPVPNLPHPDESAAKEQAGPAPSLSASHGSGTTAADHPTPPTAAAHLSQIWTQKRLQSEVMADDEAVARDAIFIDHIRQLKGDSGLQERVQLEISKTKKLESEIATARAKRDNSQKEIDKMRIELEKATTQRVTLDVSCKQMVLQLKELRDDIRRREERGRKQLGDVVEYIQQELGKQKGKMSEEDSKRVEIEGENEQLRERVTLLRDNFEKAFADYESDWKGKDEHLRTLVSTVSQKAEENRRLGETMQANQVILKNSRDEATLLQKQTEMFSTRLSDFKASEDNCAAAMSMKDALQCKLMLKIEELESKKVSEASEQHRIDAETARLRQKLKAAKSKVQQAEKMKLQLEDKCRNAQTRARQQKLQGTSIDTSA